MSTVGLAIQRRVCRSSIKGTSALHVPANLPNLTGMVCSKGPGNSSKGPGTIFWPLLCRVEVCSKGPGVQ